MLETHGEHDNLFQDDDMMDYGADTKYLSPSGRTDLANREQRVLAQYDEGEWQIEAQVRVDGEWYVESRDRLYNPPEGHDEYTVLGDRVKKNYGMFSGLSKTMRLVLAPVYALDIMYRCIRGDDINLQIIENQD